MRLYLEKKAVFYAEASGDFPASRIVFIPDESLSITKVYINVKPYRLLYATNETATLIDDSSGRSYTLHVNDSFKIKDRTYVLTETQRGRHARFFAEGTSVAPAAEILYTSSKVLPKNLAEEPVLTTEFNLKPFQLVKMSASKITLKNTEDDISYEFRLNDTFVFENRLYTLSEIIPGRKAVFLSDETELSASRRLVFIPERQVETLSSRFNVKPFQATRVTSTSVLLRNMKTGVLSEYLLNDYLVIDSHGYRLIELNAGKSAVFKSAETTDDVVKTIVYTQRRAPILPRRFFNVQPYHLTSLTKKYAVLYDEKSSRHLYFKLGDLLVSNTRLYTLRSIVPGKVAIFYCPETEAYPEHELIYTMEYGTNSYDAADDDEPVFSMSSDPKDIAGFEAFGHDTTDNTRAASDSTADELTDAKSTTDSTHANDTNN